MRIKLVRNFTNGKVPVARRKNRKGEMEEEAAAMKRYLSEIFVVSTP